MLMVISVQNPNFTIFDRQLEPPNMSKGSPESRNDRCHSIPLFESNPIRRIHDFIVGQVCIGGI